MYRTHAVFLVVLGTLMTALSATSAHATRIEDLCRLKGQEANVLMGMGLVVGLNGTGDTSRDSYVAARPFARLMENLGNPIESLTELERADSYAIVMVTLEVPASGTREGTRLDVSVEKMFNATSLDGGRLVASFLRTPIPGSPVMAYAQGPIVTSVASQGGGVVRGGGQMIADVQTPVVGQDGSVTLVLRPEYSTFPVSMLVTDLVNAEFTVDASRTIARSHGADSIKVMLPAHDRGDPSRFIADLLRIEFDPALIPVEPRVVVNERNGTIVVTANVEIGPVVISQRGLNITSVTPPIDPTPEDPVVNSTTWTTLDTGHAGERRATRLQDLLAALKQFAVPVSDQIAIIYELERAGALYATVLRDP